MYLFTSQHSTKLSGNSFRHPKNLSFCHPRENGDPESYGRKKLDSRFRGNDRAIKVVFIRKLPLPSRGGAG